MLGLLILIVIAILIAVWLAPMVPPPGGQIIRVCAYIVIVIAVIYLLVGLLSGAGAGLPAFDD